MKPRYEVADIIASYGKQFLQAYPQRIQALKTLNSIRICRTSALGGHKSQCTCCGHERYSFNSCRNRHCPKCQTVNREKWIWYRENELLPVPYYHIVFTLPDHLNQMAIDNAKEVYDSLFTSAWDTLKTFFADPKHLGAKSGMTAVLHTWGQTLNLHPHLHCIVPAGGITASAKWKTSKSNGKYLFPQKALAKVFRAKFMSAIRSKDINVKQDIARLLFKTDWIVYAKQPFYGPKQIVEYLGRYTHKVAISNHRLVNIDNGKVTFSYKDYRHNSLAKQMSLSASEFLRRFCLHILPHGYIRIRHYGILASRNKSTDLNIAREFFEVAQWTKPLKTEWKEVATQRMGFIPDQCPVCKEGVMIVVEVIPRGPPQLYFSKIQYITACA
ncbi:MAG: IS91 family transposase [Candidatus Zixiibacteriota bacterium]